MPSDSSYTNMSSIVEKNAGASMGYLREIRHRAWQMKTGRWSSTKRIDVYGSGGVSRPPLICGNVISYPKIIPPTTFLRVILNYVYGSLTVCSLKQYLPNGSEKSCILS